MEETSVGTLINEIAMNGNIMEDAVVLGDSLIPFLENDNGSVVLKGIIDQNGQLIFDTYLYTGSLIEQAPATNHQSGNLLELSQHSLGSAHLTETIQPLLAQTRDTVSIGKTMTVCESQMVQQGVTTMRGQNVVASINHPMGFRALIPNYGAMNNNNSHIKQTLQPIGSGSGQSVEQAVPEVQSRTELPPLDQRMDTDTLGGEAIEPPIGKGPFKCTCGKIFQKWPQLKRHKAEHLNDKILRCSRCPLTFNLDANLKVHKFLHEAEETGCLQCKLCPAKFTRLASLKSHLRIHEKDDNLMCPECGDEFPTKGSLEAHLDEHKPKPLNSLLHRCRMCGKSFTQLHMLKDHSKEHAAVRSQLKILNSKKRKAKSKNAKSSQPTSSSILADYENVLLSRQERKKKRACNICGKRFEKPSQLNRHLRIHTGEKPFACKECGKRFNQKGTMESHIQSMHKKEKPHKCELCQCAFSQRGNLKAHILKVHVPPGENEKVFKCEECCCVYRRLATLNNHIAKVHAVEGPQTAQEAQQVQKLVEASAEDQMPTTSTMPSSTLPTAISSTGQDSQVLSSKNPVEMSATSINNITRTVPISNLPVEPQNILSNVPTNHLKLLTSTTNDSSVYNTSVANMITCPSGTNSVNTVDDLTHQPQQKDTSISEIKVLHTEQGKLRRYPMKVKKVGEVKWHLCTHCQKGFRKPSDLIRHIRVHTQEKPYQCEICHKSFAVKSTLNTHIRTHIASKDLECRVCHKRFSMLSSLKSHERLHTGQKPFTCMQCGKSFRTSAQRRIHAKSHTRNLHGLTGKRKLLRLGETPVELSSPLKITSDGLVPVPNRSALAMTNHAQVEGKCRPYKCKECPSAFKKSSHLKQHIRSHTGEKPYKCFQCGRSFVSSGVLKNHIKTHEGVRAYTCVICHLSFTTNGSLTRHMATHTNIRPYMCPYCRKTFKTSVSCRKHIKTHRDEVVASAVNNGSQNHGTNILSTVTTIESEVTMEPPIMIQRIGIHDHSLFNEKGNQNLRSYQETHFHDFLPSLNQTVVTSTVTDADNGSLQGPSGSEAHQQILPVPSGTDCVTLGDQHLLIPNEIISTTAPLQGQDCVPESIHLHYPIACADEYQNQPGNTAQQDRAIPHRGPQQTHHLVVSEDSHTFAGHHEHTPSFNPIYEHMDIPEPLQHYINSDVSEIHEADDAPDAPPLANSITSEDLGSFEYTQQSLPESNNVADMALEADKSSSHVPLDTGGMAQGNLQTSVVNSTQSKEGEGIEKDEIRRIREISRPISEKIYHELSTYGHKMRKKEDGLQNAEGPNQCQFCLRGFRKRSDLQRHLRIHTGEKPFRCHICGKVFRVKSTREAHMKTHEGVKTVSCHVCNNLFSTKSSLRVHMRLHTGAKPYACPHCDLSFRTSGHRKAHISSHFKPSKDASPTASNVTTHLERTEAVNPQYIIPDIQIPQTVVLTNAEHMGGNVIPMLTALKQDKILHTTIQQSHGSSEANQEQSLEISADLAAAYENVGHLADGSISQDALQVIGSVQISVDGPTLQIAGLPGLDLSTLQVDDNFIQNLANVIFLPATTTSQDTQDQVEDHQFENSAATLVQEQEMILGSSVPTENADMSNCDGVLTGNDVNVAEQLNEVTESQTLCSEGSIASPSGDLPHSSSHHLLNQSVGPQDLNNFLTDAKLFCKKNENTRKQSTDPHAVDSFDQATVKKRKKNEYIRTSRNVNMADNDRFCTICYKTFLKPSLLVRHMRTHTGERPYKCDVCQRRFSQQTSLAAHSYTHTKDKPFACTLCPFRTVHRGALKKHFSKAHPNRWAEFPNRRYESKSHKNITYS